MGLVTSLPFVSGCVHGQVSADVNPPTSQLVSVPMCLPYCKYLIFMSVILMFFLKKKHEISTTWLVNASQDFTWGSSKEVGVCSKAEEKLVALNSLRDDKGLNVVPPLRIFKGNLVSVQFSTLMRNVESYLEFV